jgi:hypothetical protein
LGPNDKLEETMSLKRLLVSSVASAAILATVTANWHANAAEIGSNGDYPTGSTVGIPTGVALPPGFYGKVDAVWSQSHSVNGFGQDTGVSATSLGQFSSWTWVPGINVLGATVTFAERGEPGVLSVTVKHPKGVVDNGIGTVDANWVPINLSWSLGGGFFVDGEIGFYAPTGTYNVDNSVNTGSGHWVLEPNFSVTYLKNGWDLTAHTTFDVNFVNPETDYRNGTFWYEDLTATRNFGKFTTGPVAWGYNQITADSGPVNLNGGSPHEWSVGWEAGYNISPAMSVYGWATHDVYARNVGYDNIRAELAFVFKLL